MIIYIKKMDQDVLSTKLNVKALPIRVHFHQRPPFLEGEVLVTKLYGITDGVLSSSG